MSKSTESKKIITKEVFAYHTSREKALSEYGENLTELCPENYELFQVLDFSIKKCKKRDGGGYQIKSIVLYKEK